MAQFSRIEVYQQMEATGLVPLFYHHDIEVAKAVLKACYQGGARLLEFTNRGDAAINTFKALSQFAKTSLPGMILGVGSVTSAAAATHYMLYGANFVVTPVFRKDIAKVCNRRKVLWSPGCGTLTEIAKAEAYGCELVKLFPGSTLDPGFVKAIKGPQPWTAVMPTGGVSTEEENLKAWFDAGVTCVGMGSKLISKQILAEEVYDKLETSVRETLVCIQRL